MCDAQLTLWQPVHIRMTDATLALWALFLSAFISSTLFPGGSEVVLSYLHMNQDFNVAVLLATASVGNTLGAMTSWMIGRLLPHRVERARLNAALSRLQRFGSPVLLLSWLPILGDPLCVAAGWIRVHWLEALLFIALGKVIRYIAVLWIV